MQAGVDMGAVQPRPLRMEVGAVTVGPSCSDQLPMEEISCLVRSCWEEQLFGTRVVASAAMVRSQSLSWPDAPLRRSE
jgi:hypothetical protein